MAAIQGDDSGPLPKLTGEGLRMHDAVQYWEAVQSALSGLGLLSVAQGMDPDDVAKYPIVNLSEIPALPRDDPGHHRRHEARVKQKTQNISYRKLRYALVMKGRTPVYTAFYKSAKTNAPVFARELREACDYSRAGVAGGYFDGVTAYRMVYDRLFGADRTKQDKYFYDVAKRLQQQAKLSDGCRSTEFMTKAYAWIYKIRPCLAQPFTDEDAAEYITELMPKRLAADARRIEDKVKAEGRLTDLLYYARQLAHVLYLDQSHSAQSAALVQVSEDISARFDILYLSDMADMMLTGGV